MCFVGYIFPRVILDTCFSFLLILGGLGVGVLVLGFWIGFLGVRISVDGVWNQWCGAFWFFGVWALYINIEE